MSKNLERYIELMDEYEKKIQEHWRPVNFSDNPMMIIALALKYFVERDYEEYLQRTSTKKENVDYDTWVDVALKDWVNPMNPKEKPEGPPIDMIKEDGTIRPQEPDNITYKTGEKPKLEPIIRFERREPE